MLTPSQKQWFYENKWTDAIRRCFSMGVFLNRHHARQVGAVAINLALYMLMVANWCETRSAWARTLVSLSRMDNALAGKPGGLSHEFLG